MRRLLAHNEVTSHVICDLSCTRLPHRLVPISARHATRNPLNITEHPTAEWTAQQIVEAFPWDTAPRYLLRDRDTIYGKTFQQRVRHMGIEEVKMAPRSPRQKPYVERVIGSFRRDALEACRRAQ